MGSLLIKDTTREERERLVLEAIGCGGGCENCSSCWLGGGSPDEIYRDYIEGKRELSEINAEYMDPADNALNGQRPAGRCFLPSYGFGHHDRDSPGAENEIEYGK